MGRVYIDHLKNSYQNKDIWIIGSGAALNYFPSSFFDDKVTIGINRVARYVKCDFSILKHLENPSEITNSKFLPPHHKLIISEMSGGSGGEGGGYPNPIVKNALYFKHFNKIPHQIPKTDSISKDSSRLVASWSTLTSALHFGAFLGAKNLFMLAANGELIDGEPNVKGYYDNIKPHQNTKEGYTLWLSKIQSHTQEVCNKLKTEYGCNIYNISFLLK